MLATLTASSGGAGRPMAVSAAEGGRDGPYVGVAGTAGTDSDPGAVAGNASSAWPLTPGAVADDDVRIVVATDDQAPVSVEATVEGITGAEAGTVEGHAGAEAGTAAVVAGAAGSRDGSDTGVAAGNTVF